MSRLLSKNQKVVTDSSKTECTIKAFLGGGSQGEVYLADLMGSQVAVKWYFKRQATSEQLKSLRKLIDFGKPNDRFLWPMDIVTNNTSNGFGYVMPLREPRYRGLEEMLSATIDPSFEALAIAGFELSNSFFQLHMKGLCYRDISHGNVFLDPKTGDILICDNDNVTIDGSAIGGVYGTPRYMAPEIVRGEKAPSICTDLYSLATLLFYVFMVHNPLEGEKEADIHAFDAPAMKRLYGDNPVFIFDPQNDSNRPIPGYQDNPLIYWPIYPQFLRDLFIRSFTDGIKDPENGRVRESEWRSAMVRLKDSIMVCPKCKNENFFDLAVLKKSAWGSKSCWSCGAALPMPARMRIGKQLVILNSDKQLYPHHIDSDRMYDFSKPVAQVSQHPKKPGVLGLKNLTEAKWVSISVDGKVKEINPGQSIKIDTGIKVQFGKTEGEFKL